MKVMEKIDIKKLWESFNFRRPEELNKKESIFIQLQNQAYESDWSLPRVVEGWIFIESWFDNMIAGQKGRYGATRLQWRPDMGKPIRIAITSNSNNGISMWFIPKVSIGGDWSWRIRVEVEYAKGGQPAFARLYAEKKQ